MPDLGIGEALAAFTGFDLLGALGLGGGEAAAAGAGAGAEAALAGGGLADIVGTGAGLAGGETGLAGTVLAGGSGLTGDALMGTAGLGSLGTATDFLAAPTAIGGTSAIGGAGFNAAADAALSEAASSGLSSGVGGITGTPSIASLTPSAAGGALSSSGLSPSVANANAGASVFETGTNAVPGLSSGTPTAAPSAIPGGGGAAGVSAPTGIGGVVDPTAAGASGAASIATDPAAAAAPASSVDQLLGKTGSGVMDSLTKNPLGIALGAGGLGYNILQGQKNTKNQAALTADAAQATANSNKLTASGEDLQKYLTDGTLPANYQKIVDQAINDAKTTAISNAAGQGQPTDPTKNTALATELSKIENSKAGMQAQVAQTLFSSGSTLVNAGQAAAGLSGALYQALVNNDTTQAANTGKAIATLAAALNNKASNTLGKTNITVDQAA